MHEHASSIQVEGIKPYERIVGEPIEKHLNPLETHPSAVKATELLTDVIKLSDVGKNGPAIAARATEKSRGDKDLTRYEDLFGRDALIFAEFLIDVTPELMKATIHKLAELQAMREHGPSEEQFGKIIHLDRDPASERAINRTKKSGWEWPYYGSIDSTPRFAKAFWEYWKKSIDDENPEEAQKFLEIPYKARNGNTYEHIQALKNSIYWITQRMAENPEGLVEFRKTSPGHHGNIAWRDSEEGYPRADGTYADNTYGIASVEVQALAYDSLMGAADIYQHIADSKGYGQTLNGYYTYEAEFLREQAERLRQQVLEKFWIEDERGGYFALGTERDDEGNVKPIAVRTSNMGHLLNSRILDGDGPEITNIRRQLVETLFSDEMLSPNGIRTLSNKEVVFAPFKYHDGTVWLWEQEYIAQGLEKHDYLEKAEELRKKVLDIVKRTNLFPEYVSGGNENTPLFPNRIVEVEDTRNGMVYKMEQMPQEIQAWSVGAVMSIYRRKLTNWWSLRGIAVKDLNKRVQARQSETTS